MESPPGGKALRFGSPGLGWAGRAAGGGELRCPAFCRVLRLRRQLGTLCGPPLSARPGSQVRQSIIGFDVPGLDTSSAWEAGFGSLYWMEGVVTRLRDKHGGAPPQPCIAAAASPQPRSRLPACPADCLGPGLHTACQPDARLLWMLQFVWRRRQPSPASSPPPNWNPPVQPPPPTLPPPSQAPTSFSASCG